MITLQEKFNAYYDQLEEAARPSDEIKKRFCEMNGFNLNGDGWIVLGNTYPIKDELKKKGARYNGNLKHWILPVEDKKYSLYKISADDLFEKNRSSGVWDWHRPIENTNLMSKISKLEIQQENTNTSNLKPISNILKVGDKITIDINKIQLKSTGEGRFGVYYLYEIIDINGYYFVWYSSNKLDLQRLPKKINGIIKEFRSFRGTEQVILTRCKFIEDNKSETQKQFNSQQNKQEQENGIVSFNWDMFK